MDLWNNESDLREVFLRKVGRTSRNEKKQEAKLPKKIRAITI